MTNPTNKKTYSIIGLKNQEKHVDLTLYEATRLLVDIAKNDLSVIIDTTCIVNNNTGSFVGFFCKYHKKICAGFGSYETEKYLIKTWDFGIK